MYSLQKQFTIWESIGHCIANWANVASVIWLHSSRSILSKLWQFYKTDFNKYCYNIELQIWRTLANAWNPLSVKWVHSATSNVFKSWQPSPSLTRVASVNCEHPDIQRVFNWRQYVLTCSTATSVIYRKKPFKKLQLGIHFTLQFFKFTSCKFLHPLVSFSIPSSVTLVHPFARMCSRSLHPRPIACNPSSDIFIHQDMFRCIKWGHPAPIDIRDSFVISAQDSRFMFTNRKQ